MKSVATRTGPCIREDGLGRPGWRARQILRGLGREQRGVTALEFALVAPVFFLVLFMIIEVGFMLLADSTLDRAATHIARMGRVGYFQDAGNCREAIQTELDKELSLWADRTKLQAQVLSVYEPHGNNGDSAASVQCNGTGSAGRGDLVVFRLSFEQPAMTGIVHFLGMDPFHYERVIAIQNEP